ncbi:hypothetical protein NLT11_000640 [Cronobacter sakazakii]|uniref:Uncharacterized protein n=6 Tax=Cronobacter sakazakii TaxID=28141 RepID=A7MNX0_CROS8|nr:unnamed protein product [Cronobacter sakazakii]EGL72906.1 hypothetical protein CSE899_09147 [Cronobacter sakazakii E899]ELY4803352.1 hypothetical protein [Cronobacter malonaticus]CCK02280.1 FIG00553982: hypothetical protein [Cronobacter sakazakii 701]CCK06008.1 FIG00553982: hypothetical protein [Cronobacter sakazakii 696]ABU77379.1 hypothetical protein ESA_02130 [Cronobacter sakazakii ATCC BAA-894]
MKKSFLMCCLFLGSTGPASAVVQGREYNTWYEKDAVLYDMTQTAGGSPVMLSISQAGFRSANMVISSLTPGKCPAQPRALEINSDIIPADYFCTQQGSEKIEHYLVRDADKVNALVEKLRSDFTLMSQKEIKVWAANIKSPKHGIAPRF